MWSVLLLLWSGALFGQVYRATGLIGVLLESLESLLPARDRDRRALAMISLSTGFVATFNGYACYGVAIPGLRALGFEAAQPAVAYLVYVTWSVPFSGMLVGTLVGSTATHVPISEIVRASGLLDIPLVIVAYVGGMAFGQGAPAVLMFAQMQIGVGPTNAIKPPLIRFAASLAGVADADSTIFRIGLFWGFIELAVVTVGFALVAPILR